MPGPVDALILDLLEWIGPKARPYREAIEAWRFGRCDRRTLSKAPAHLYRSVGFRLVKHKPAKQWGVDVIEERYELNLE